MKKVLVFFTFLLTFSSSLAFDNATFSFFSDVLRRHIKHTSDIQVRSVAFMTSADNSDLIWPLWDLILNVKPMPVAIITEESFEPSRGFLENCLYVVMSAGVLEHHVDELMNNTEINMWVIPESEEVILPKLRLTSLITLYGEDSGGRRDITDIYAVKGRKFKRPLGIWSVENGFMYEEEFIWDRRYDLYGTHFLAIVETNEPSSNLYFNEEGKVYRVDGVFPDVFEIIRGKFNFTYNLTVAPDRRWGNIVNGEFNGWKFKST